MPALHPHTPPSGRKNYVVQEWGYEFVECKPCAKDSVFIISQSLAPKTL